MIASTKWISRLVVLIALLTTSVVSVFADTITGPSSSQSPYVIGLEPGVVIRSILTVGDAVNDKPDGTPYRLVGIPDGLGAIDNGDGTFTVLMNHELRQGAGVVRAHGANGAFISKWVIRKGNLQVLKGEDLIQNIATWNPITGAFNPPAQGVRLARLCSADLPSKHTFFDPKTRAGYQGYLFMNGEETGAEGRAFAHTLEGISYELPWLGKMSWENSVTRPVPGLNTVVVGLDDSNNGQVYIYVGQKTVSDNPVEAAGLTNGVLYGVKIDGLAVETNTTTLVPGSAFSVHAFGNVAYMTGAELETQSVANGVTAFQRPEDGAWNPLNPREFYFVTTASFTGMSRLWRLTFHDPTDPKAGGVVEMLLDGTEGPKMMDNLTINRRGQIFIQEDPGNQPHLAKIWRYTPSNDRLTLIAQHDPEFFDPASPSFLTQDEESSGIIDVSHILGRGWFLLDVQAHYLHPDAELVEGGQLLAMHVPQGRK
jgi:hypothetical protein